MLAYLRDGSACRVVCTLKVEVCAVCSVSGGVCRVCSIRGNLQCGWSVVYALYVVVCSVGVQWCVQYTCKFTVWVSNGVCSIRVSLQCGCPMVCAVYV